VIKEIRGARG